MDPFTAMLLIGAGAFVISQRKTKKRGAVSGEAATAVRRHGMQMVGNCKDFTCVDVDTWVDYAGKLEDELEAKGEWPWQPGSTPPSEAENILVVLFGHAFPECPWPPAPGTTFHNGTKTWQTVVAEMQSFIKSLQGAALSQPLSTVINRRIGEILSPRFSRRQVRR